MMLWQKVILGLVLGVITGIAFPEYVDYIKPIGDIFLRLIKMIIAPLIFFSLVSGIVSVNNSDSLGRLGIKATIAFTLTTLFAVLFGIGIAIILKPGVGITIDLPVTNTNLERAKFDVINFLINIVPDNALGAIVYSNILQVVFLAIFTGITLNKMSNSSTLRQLFSIISKMIMKMISLIILLAPYGAFALTAWVVGNHGIGILFGLSKLMFAIVLAMIMQYLIFGVLIMVFCRISPLPFYRKSIEYQILALSTSSSKASLVTTMDVCKNKLGVSSATTNFILPLGASINMDGFAINLALTTIFFAQLFGITLQLHDYFVIILMVTIGTIGGAGIPGASLIMLPMVLSAVNLPIEGVAILVGIDRILDMLRTVINITGDATITLIIDQSEGTFDEETYYS
ncbi:dicarboxylate/amino acid:cation symporter [Orientia tsutsugamushi]|uniref:dicarboxylate/amino acid:cation symporter n=1 Tax=Orientia tsutsugamushi TaxID=784 RepID=UPI0005F8A82A|nr:dicarboxylate/amino acid:cation symporter [Orientia tsutsugamushi]